MAIYQNQPNPYRVKESLRDNKKYNRWIKSLQQDKLDHQRDIEITTEFFDTKEQSPYSKRVRRINISVMGLSDNDISEFYNAYYISGFSDHE